MIAPRLRGKRARRWPLLALTVVVIAVGSVVAATRSADPAVEVRQVSISSPGGPGVGGTVDLDAALYLPERTPAPAVIIAHGFGGSRQSVAADAERLAAEGLAVLAYSARGFGASTGLIALDSIDHEVVDGRSIVDWLARQPEILLDADGDPRVGVSGGSYGGALALMLAGTDPRIDAVVASITWNDLGAALFPDHLLPGDALYDDGPDDTASRSPAPLLTPTDGVFKQAWAAAMLSSVMGVTDAADSEDSADSAGSSGGPSSPGGAAGPSGAAAAGAAIGCGRLMPDVCAAYTRVATTGRITAPMRQLLERSSPAQVVSDITAPTLLIQGEADTLFGLDQADATARAIAAAGTPVAVTWFAGGHSGGGLDEGTQQRATEWLIHYLTARGPTPSERFEYVVPGPLTSGRHARSRTLATAAYPGTDHQDLDLERLGISGPEQTVLRPPGAQPAAITSLPGFGGSGALGVLAAMPGQYATFTSEPLPSSTVLTGSATVGLTVARVPTGQDGPPPGDDVLYVSVLAADTTAEGSADQSPTGAADSGGTDPDASSAAPGTDADGLLGGAGDTAAAIAAVGSGPAGGAVAAVRLPDLPADGSPVTVSVQLPAVVLPLSAGQSVRVRVATTDTGYAGPTSPELYRIGLPDGAAITLPLADGEQIGSGDGTRGWAIALLALVIASGLGLWWVGRRPATGPIRRPAVEPPREAGPSATASPDTEPAPPLRIRGLRKQYPGGVLAVDHVDLVVERGQVLGLLGPNGAGKTTTLRMVMGLITPTAGTVEVFGDRVGAGSPVLSRIGSFVEGVGFLPHLSGRDNLVLYWRATGRDRDGAHLEQVLRIAGLGEAVHRSVRTYSQGMRQRLAIAQAMLGLPDLLLLDEPTNGLDPPQIHAMREMLQRYAATGRTVVVSSHLLAEVEQTCSHVVIIARGRTIAAGTVAEMVASSHEMFFATDMPERAAEVLRGLPGCGEIRIAPTGVLADLGAVTMPTALAALVAAGVPLQSAAPHNRLEDVFLDLVMEDRAVASATGGTV